MPWLQAKQVKKVLGLPKNSTSLYRSSFPYTSRTDENGTKEFFIPDDKDDKIGPDVKLADEIVSASDDDRTPNLNFCPSCGVRLRDVKLL